MKKIVALSLIFFTAVFIFAQSVQNQSDLLQEEIPEYEQTPIQKILSRANQAYEQNQIDEAYRIINGALKLDAYDKSVIYFARLIYAKKLELIKENYNAEDFIEIQANLEEFHKVSDVQIKKLVRLVEFSQKPEDPSKIERKVISVTLGVVIIITIAGVIFMLFLMILIRKNMKQQRAIQEQYLNNFSKFVAIQSNYLSIGGLSDLYTDNLKIAGSSAWDSAKALPGIDFSEEDLTELREYAIKCEALGQKIDNATGRKNNSKNVSELVYKLSIKMGLPQGMAMLNFCAAMVYDAGFLGMDSELLTATDLTDEQREGLKNHVNLADRYLDFVPKKYWSVFDDAARKHHENMDGTGYPHGLKGDDIPLVARLIRVAETYVSLSSKRNYRETFDKVSAIEMLKEQPHFYDPAAVELLETIV